MLVASRNNSRQQHGMAARTRAPPAAVRSIPQPVPSKAQPAMETTGNRPARASAPEVLALWQRYRSDGDRELRDRLVFTFLPMVRHIVYRKVREVPAECDVEDFLSCGLEALIRSIERFDPQRGATLEQYAWTRIHGAVLDELRRHDWAPRSLRRDERAINAARESFLAVHEREPTREELAARVGMTVAELTRRIDQVALAEVGSLNRVVRSDDSATIERIDTLESTDADSDPVRSAERDEAKQRFREAFARLTAQEREVAVLLYVQDWTLRDIGERLGVSESRISQIHTQLRRRLYVELADERSLFAAVA
jgi:RNA polymerase sigma factor for flagellar operon FliA